MLFPTVGFAVFFSLVFLGAWLLRPRPVLWKAFLLLAGIVFFGWWDWRAAAVLVGLVVVSHGAALAIERRTAPGGAWFVAGAVVVNLGTFVAVTRTDFDGLDLGVVVPLGVALLVLRCISYVVDVHRGLVKPPPILDAAVAIGFFPMALAGPLARASQLLPQLADPPDARRLPAARAFRLLLVGLFQLWVLAPYLAADVVDPVFSAPDQHTGTEVLLAALAFTVQLFTQLAGYASMAVGAALLLGLRLPDNFDAPFTATTLRAFWHRWASTFSTWLRDYVYLPLGGDRGGSGVRARNVLLAFVASGLLFVGGWWGAVWGAVMAVALLIEHGVRQDDGAPSGVSAVVGWLVTLAVVSCGFVLVRAGDWSTTIELIDRLPVWGAAPLVTPLALVVVAGVIAVQLLPRDVPRAFDVAFSRLPVVVQGLLVALGLLLIDALGQGVVDPAVPARF